jgi:hypothetical protein
VIVLAGNRAFLAPPLSQSLERLRPSQGEAARPARLPATSAPVRPIAAPLDRCAELLGVDLAAVRKAASEVEPCVRSDGTKVWSLIQFERQLCPRGVRAPSLRRLYHPSRPTRRHVSNRAIPARAEQHPQSGPKTDGDPPRAYTGPRCLPTDRRRAAHASSCVMIATHATISRRLRRFE